ncbi:2OG-Fe(II) oxygenase [Candidatus Nomurabacteria bacterium]|nr:2OG-Fe(II) oxygenase [Candidatus Nomurabacteria bacterium]
MNKKNQWPIVQIDPSYSAEICALLSKLSSNNISAIQIQNFLQPNELNIIIENMRSQDINWYEGKKNEQGRIGISTTEYHYLENGKQKYFDLVTQADKVQDQIFDGVENPINRIIKLFSSTFEPKIATESSMQNSKYFSGLVRAMGAKSTLHFDYAVDQLPGWSVSDLEDQYALVLHLQVAEKGGELNVYNRQWEPADEKFNNDVGQKGTYGFTEDFLQDTPYATITPSSGDLIIFRSRNFHQVAAIESSKPRLTFGTFMGLKNNTLSLWS